ncbi:jerky protein homolog-like [Aphis gossypii]|uniref:jerky protein homolog-like n=1 Tax=Aphis gossypii TaxID=80765 RepID=UPI0021592CD1|nr:jerky protein homolog-like [Aphis gossypii]
MAEKRKRVVLGFNQKFEIIKRLKIGETATNIAQIYGVGRTTVNDIKRDAEKIEQHVSQMQINDGDVKSRKTMKLPEGIPLSGPIITTNASEMNKKLDGDPNFKARTGWLDKFKFRHVIHQLDISGEKLSANSAVIAEFKEQFKLKINVILKLLENKFIIVMKLDSIGKPYHKKHLTTFSEKTAPGLIQKDRINAMDAIFNVASAWADLSVSNLKNGWNKLWPEIIPCESEETEPSSVEEIVQFCNNGLHSEILSTKEVTDWLENDKQDGGFEILNDE